MDSLTENGLMKSYSTTMLDISDRIYASLNFLPMNNDNPIVSGHFPTMPTDVDRK